MHAQRLSHLTSYLQELHSRGLANSDHTTLLLNCYTKLADDKALSDFLHTSSSTSAAPAKLTLPSSTGRRVLSGKEQEPPFDLETAIRVCRQAGYYEHAVWLAERYGEHAEYLRIQIEDRSDCIDALAYLRKLEPVEAQDSLLKYGRALLAAEPQKTTDLLINVCCGETGSDEATQPAIEGDKKAGSSSKGYMSYLAYGTSAEPGVPPTEPAAVQTNATAETNGNWDVARAYNVSDAERRTARLPDEQLPSPRQFFAHFIDHPGQFIRFLEAVGQRRYGETIVAKTSDAIHGLDEPLPDVRSLDEGAAESIESRDEQAVWNTLLEMWITEGTPIEVDQSPTQDQLALQTKALQMMRQRSSVPYDETRALLVCSTTGFVPGFILLYEQLGMYEDILRRELVYIYEPLRCLYADFRLQTGSILRAPSLPRPCCRPKWSGHSEDTVTLAHSCTAWFCDTFLVTPRSCRDTTTTSARFSSKSTATRSCRRSPSCKSSERPTRPASRSFERSCRVTLRRRSKRLTR